jgi:lipase maturation factor 1
MDKPRRFFLSLFDSEHGAADRLISRWLFLRALGLIYFSAFFSLLFQVRGLIGTQGILPASELLQDARAAGGLRFWAVPSLLWISSSDHMLMALMWVGLIASVLLAANVWPRAMLLACFLCFLSFVGAAQDFSGYQSDGMLLEAGFISLFLAPPGLLPGWGARRPPMRAAILLLLWEWFRIYFESGVVKLESGDPTWRNLTAMYEYYQNGPLPTWIGWYVQHLPNWFHRATAGATLGVELVLVWMAWVPGRWRVACFFLVTAWQIGVIATANYTFLNYLVLVLAFLLLDDAFLRRFVPARWSQKLITENTEQRREYRGLGVDQPDAEADGPETADSGRPFARGFGGLRVGTSAIALTWIFYATTLPLLRMFWHDEPLPAAPVSALEPFRIANQYGLFAVMTPHRYEIEFQGSNDGQTWVAYPFRYKPQDVRPRPGIYAPYQPRFDWNLWFASLGSWVQNPLVPRTEELLLENDRDVLGLFAGDPFGGTPPKYVRAVLWQYWFSTPQQKRAQGVWWTRQYLGTYAPTITRREDGRFGVVAGPSREEMPEP